MNIGKINNMGGLYGDTPLILKNNKDEIIIRTIHCLTNDWKKTDVKDVDEAKSSYKIWTNGKWNQIKKVFRFKTTQKMYHLQTDLSEIIVSENCEFITFNNKNIKAKNCKQDKTKLLANKYNLPKNNLPKDNNKNKKYMEKCLNFDKTLTKENITCFVLGILSSIDGFHYKCPGINRFLKYYLPKILTNMSPDDLQYMDGYDSDADCQIHDEYYRINSTEFTKFYYTHFKPKIENQDSDKWYGFNRDKDFPKYILETSEENKYCYLCGVLLSTDEDYDKNYIKYDRESKKYSISIYQLTENKLSENKPFDIDLKNNLEETTARIGLYYVLNSLGFNCRIFNKSDVIDVNEEYCGAPEKFKTVTNKYKTLEVYRKPINTISFLGYCQFDYIPELIRSKSRNKIYEMNSKYSYSEYSHIYHLQTEYGFYNIGVGCFTVKDIQI